MHLHYIRSTKPAQFLKKLSLEGTRASKSDCGYFHEKDLTLMIVHNSNVLQEMKTGTCCVEDTRPSVFRSHAWRLFETMKQNQSVLPNGVGLVTLSGCRSMIRAFKALATCSLEGRGCRDRESRDAATVGNECGRTKCTHTEHECRARRSCGTIMNTKGW